MSDGSVVLASRHGGVPAWSPDGLTLAIATFSTSGGGYNGNPNRNDDDPPAALAGGSQYALWRVPAPRAVDDGAQSLTLAGVRLGALDVGLRSGLADDEEAVLRDRAVGCRVGRASGKVPAADGAGKRRGRR